MRNRVKSKLAREMMKECEEGRYYPTKAEVLEWFDIINHELFGNKLPPFKKIEIRRRRGCWGEAAGFTKKNGDKYTTLSMNIYHRSKQHFIEVLAHECIHHYQWLNENTMDHGTSFTTWKLAFEKHKVNLRISS